MENNYDFSGWATRNDIRCADGRTIRKDAFKDDDKKKVPLVWNHRHGEVGAVLGHAILENRDEGVYAYGYFNNEKAGQNAKELVRHGDVTNLSIYANELQHRGKDVMHGVIRELSLVLAGANPGAFIDSVIAHGIDGIEDGTELDDMAYIYTDEDLVVSHAACNPPDEKEKKTVETEKKTTENKEKTVKDVIDTFNEEQMKVFYAMLGVAAEEAGKAEKSEKEDNGGTKEMKHNVFDNDVENREDTLTHAQMEEIINDAKRYGSVKESFLAHAANYGIENIEYLFPEARTLNNPPDFIKRDMDWVQKVMGGVHKTPFSRIKSMFANITEDEARAKGYIKGKLKKEEVFSLLKRTTTPTTIYKKQKLDRDDIIDITDFDVIAWLKSEMRMMLDEEIARAVLVGDGRLASDDDHINETNIRPVWKDAELYTVKSKVKVASTATDEEKAKAFIKAAIKSRKKYKGSGNPTLYTTEDVVTDCLLIEDATGRTIYDSVEKLATVLRVKEIVTVPVMEGLVNEEGGALMGIIVNLNDYNVGADKGGAINMFDDFDIDYNQMKYLIETRCSGALTKPYSALVLELEETTAA